MTAKSTLSARLPACMYPPTGPAILPDVGALPKAMLLSLKQHWLAITPLTQRPSQPT